jgi:hypothetical protein
LTFHHFAVDLTFVVVDIALRFRIGRVFPVTKRLIIACGFLAAVPFAASASRLISCSSCDPTPVVLTSLGTGALDVPLNSSSSDQEFEFENDTNGIITSLEFDATIDANLTSSNTTIVYNTANPNGEVTSGPTSGNPILTLFSCAQTLTAGGGAAAGFFQNCTVTYNTTTGALSYLFAGTGPPNPDFGENLNFGTWKDQEAGIPSCPAGEPPSYCVPPPPPPGGPDADRGIFTIGFEGFATCSNDPSDCAASEDYTNPNNPLSVTGSYTAVTPEPSYVHLLVSGLFLLWFVRRRKVAQ